ncbi:MAG: hypothetical protein OEW67_00675 [Cyclobacteriaceae bacterium]|nr:hypothetical protein [Cyclobacteriaceae bacterium]
MRNIILSFVLLFISLTAFSQEAVLNTNPPSLKWKRIDTEDFRIIFPVSYESEAQRMANTLQTIHAPEAKTLGTLPKKISVILQNQNSISNGFVSIGPRRSEFFTSSPQNYNFLGTNEWMNLLASHEYRHIVQYAHSNTGMTKFFKTIFGQYTQAALSNLAVPTWFWEGDATMIETAFTKSGRGRLPNFDRTFRANLVEGKRYKYDKQYLRSYKDFVPNHYVLGYHFTTHVRRKTNDANVWSDVTERAFKWPIIPFAFSSSLKKSTGKNLKENYNEMLDELDGLWTDQIENLQLTSFETINKRKKTIYTDYSNPMPMIDGSILCMKSGIGNIQQFVIIDKEGNEKVVHTPGVINNSGSFSISGNQVVWNEFRYNPRYPNQSYSVIETLNTGIRKNKKLTSKTRFHSAALSPSGTKILTVDAKVDGSYQVVVIDAFYGSEIKRFDSEPNTFYNLPTWSSSENQVLVMKTNSLGKSVIVLDYETGVEKELIHPSHENTGNAFLHDDYLFYHSPYSGIDNVYAMELVSGKHFQITSSKYGAYNAAVSLDSKSIYYNDHTVNGLDIVRIPFDPKSWIPLEKVKVDKVEYYQPIVEQEAGDHLLENISTTEYDVKKYGKLRGLINLHSWGPLLTSNINELEAGLLSRDVMSTTSLSAGVVYDAVEQTAFGVGRASYQGLWPILDVEVIKGKRKEDRSTDNKELKVEWEESSIETGLRIPLNLTSGAFRQQLTLSNSLGIREINNYQSDLGTLGRFRDGIGSALVLDTVTNTYDTVKVDIVRLNSTDLNDGKSVYNHFELRYSTFYNQSSRDIYPKWGFVLNLDTYNTIYGDFNGTLTAINTRFFLPGLFKHHSFYFVASSQIRKSHSDFNLYSFQNRIFRARGHGFYNDKTASTFRSNYVLPIWHPDIALGPLVYVKRFKLNGFIDVGKSSIENYYFIKSNFSFFTDDLFEVKYKSFGVELTMDFNVLRLPYDLEIGVRLVHASSRIVRDNEDDVSFADTQFEFMIGNLSF